MTAVTAVGPLAAAVAHASFSGVSSWLTTGVGHLAAAAVAPVSSAGVSSWLAAGVGHLAAAAVAPVSSASAGAGAGAGAGADGPFAAVADAVLRGVVLTHPLGVGGLVATAAIWAGFATRPEPARRRVMAMAAAAIDSVQAAAATTAAEARAQAGQPVVGPLAAGLRLRRLRRAGVPHLDRVAAELPAIVEVMTVALTSGLSITASLQMALDHRDADSSTGRWLARLATPDRPLDEALDSFGRTCGPRARTFAATVTGAMRTGLPLAQELDRLGRELRDDLRRQTERKVRRLPVLLLFPLVLCVLPALGLVAIVPVLVAAFGA